MAQPRIFEGTAEEIAEQLRCSRLTGRLQAIITPDEHEGSGVNGAGETLDRALAPLLDEADRIERETPVPHTDPHERAFGKTVEEKYRKMGFKL